MITDVSLKVTTIWLIVLGSAARKACGDRIYPMICRRLNPSALAASSCP